MISAAAAAADLSSRIPSAKHTARMRVIRTKFMTLSTEAEPYDLNESYPYRIVCQCRISQNADNLGRKNEGLGSCRLAGTGEQPGAGQIRPGKGTHLDLHLRRGLATGRKRRAAEIQRARELFGV